MLKRHETELRNALDPLAYKRYVTLSRRQFRYWVGAERLGSKSWETLINHLPEDVDAKTLAIIEHDDDILIFHKSQMSSLA